MRLELNLNKYYENLDLEKINKIFSSMLDMKPGINDLEYLYNLKRDLTSKEKIAKNIREVDLESRVVELDEYMTTLGKDTIFGTEKDEIFQENRIKEIIQEYNYLMSEPEKDKEGDKNKKKDSNKNVDDIQY